MFITNTLNNIAPKLINSGYSSENAFIFILSVYIIACVNISGVVVFGGFALFESAPFDFSKFLSLLLILNVPFLLTMFFSSYQKLFRGGTK